MMASGEHLSREQKLWMDQAWALKTNLFPVTQENANILSYGISSHLNTFFLALPLKAPADYISCTYGEVSNMWSLRSNQTQTIPWIVKSTEKH